MQEDILQEKAGVRVNTQSYIHIFNLSNMVSNYNKLLKQKIKKTGGWIAITMQITGLDTVDRHYKNNSCHVNVYVLSYMLFLFFI